MSRTVHANAAPGGKHLAGDTFGRVADFALRRCAGSFPAEVLRTASYQFLDTLGVTIASGPMEAGRIARETASMLFCNGGGEPGARMLFDGRRVSIAGAAYAAIRDRIVGLIDPASRFADLAGLLYDPPAIGK